MCFLSEGSTLCWVDLFKGLLVCDLSGVLKYNSDPEFSFIPLPTHDLTCDASIPRALRAEEFRSMAYIQGAFRFVSMEGYAEHKPGDDLELAVWTLSSDLSQWHKTREYNVANIWANETHQAGGMLKIAASLPVLSMYEVDVVYLVFTDVRVVRCEPEYRGQYLIRVDMLNNKVQFYPGNTNWIHSQMMASDFSAYQQGSVDHPACYTEAAGLLLGEQSLCLLLDKNKINTKEKPREDVHNL
uniref:Uncharacterized protein n=1 Tax=Avena sativa TaxID=4498 RepID=A0ACD6AGV0_AVESA